MGRIRILLVLEYDLIVKEFLSVGQVLHCPGLVLSLLLLVESLLLHHLSMSLDVDHFGMLWFEALEVVRHVSMGSQLRNSGTRVLGHDVGHVGSADLELVLRLLLISPGLFPGFLLGRQSLVVLLQLLQLLLLPHAHLVLQHSSHSGRGFCLVCILSFL